MKAFLCLFFVAAEAVAQGLFIFSNDGKTAGSSPRELPSQGLNLATHEVLVGLHARTDEERAACGWYSYGVTNIGFADGFVVASNALVFAETSVMRWQWWRLPPTRGYDISKYTLCIELDRAGKLEAFMSYLSQDAKTKFLWDACQVLNRTNSFVLQFEAAAPSAFGLDSETVSNLLWKARVK